LTNEEKYVSKLRFSRFIMTKDVFFLFIQQNQLKNVSIISFEFSKEKSP